MKSSINTFDYLHARMASENIHEQVDAVKKLGELNDPRVAKELFWDIPFVSISKQGLITNAIIKSCKNNGKPAIKNVVNVLKSEYCDVLKTAELVLNKLGKKTLSQNAVEPLIDAPGYHYQGQEIALRLLGIIKEPAVKPLIKALKNRKKDIRMKAAEALGNIGNSLAIEPLIKAIKDKDEDVRFYVTNALKEITGNYDLKDNEWKKWWKTRDKKS